MSKKNRSKLIFIIPALLAVGVMAFGITLAMLKTETLELTNKFTVGEITTEIEENPEVTKTNIKKDPVVRNLGPNDCIVRMRVTISPKQIADDVERGKIRIDFPDQGSAGDRKDTWTEGNDGFWYYQGIVKAGGETTALFTTIDGIINLETGMIEDAYKDLGDFQITLYQEAVQTVVYDEDGKSVNVFENGQYDQDKALEIWELYEGKQSAAQN